MPLRDDKSRITAIIDKKLEESIIQLAEEEKRTKSAMTAILIEEAVNQRLKIK